MLKMTLHVHSMGALPVFAFAHVLNPKAMQVESILLLVAAVAHENAHIKC